MAYNTGGAESGGGVGEGDCLTGHGSDVIVAVSSS